jgi:hypothetical protein
LPEKIETRSKGCIALEHVAKKFFDSGMLQLFDFELFPYRSNDDQMISFDRDALAVTRRGLACRGAGQRFGPTIAKIAP